MKKVYQTIFMEIRRLDVEDVVRTSTRDGENFGFIGGWDWDQWFTTT